MSHLEHRNEERPQGFLRSSLHGKGLPLLLEDLRNLAPAIAAIFVYGIVTHLIFGRFCPMLILTDFPCPGCGMTRALALVLTGRLSMAWELQPLIYGWILLAAAFGIRRYLIGKKMSSKEKNIWLLALGLLLAGSLVLYGYRIFAGFPEGIAGQGKTLWQALAELVLKFR